MTALGSVEQFSFKHKPGGRPGLHPTLVTQLVEAYKAGHGYEAVAKMFNVNISTVYRYVQIAKAGRTIQETLRLQRQKKALRMWP